MATYNGEKFIEEQLLSILKQTRQPEEVVICDDNSSDNTAKIIAQFIEDNGLQDRWKLIINKENKGYPMNFFYCIDNCKGDIVFLSDQDDVWKIDKIERMETVLNENPNIQLLSCNYGVIDADNNKINGLMTPKTSETMKITPVYIQDILRSFRWPGMTMAIRKNYYKKICSNFRNLRAAHDMIFAIFASNDNGFYYYDYIGVYHRRHSNNTAKEEHRIFKLLNLERKLFEVEKYNNILEEIVCKEFNLNTEVNTAIKERLKISKFRYDILKKRKFSKLFSLYIKNMNYLRVKSFICDFWLLCFGGYGKYSN
ncbi:glycosyltransferase [Clostridium thermosuccinogenes]|nr:glycosyltransferase [Pseudoclostridium thermosuccinogenes]